MKYTSVSIGGVTLGDPQSVDYQTATFVGTKRVDQPAPSCDVRFDLDPDEAARLGSLMRAIVFGAATPLVVRLSRNVLRHEAKIARGAYRGTRKTTNALRRHDRHIMRGLVAANGGQPLGRLMLYVRGDISGGTP